MTDLSLYKKLPATVALLFLFLLNVSCNKDSILPDGKVQKDYFPLRVGQYAIYDVDSITFNDVTMTSDTVRYQLKELLDTSFIDNSGDTAYRINRMRRNSDADVWETADMWSAALTGNTAEKIEENLRFIKLLFPAEDGKSWNGNAHINTEGTLSYLANWNYVYSDVNTIKYINGSAYDSTVTVTAQDIENLVQKDLEQEIYAARFGLIYKISQHVSKQNVAGSWAHPEKGYIIRMKIREFHR